MSLSLPSRFGKYWLVRKLAQGGMAELYLGIESNPLSGNRFVTIKCIREKHAQDQDYWDFFAHEGRVVLKCCHPHIPQAYELGITEGIHYLALEHIRGHTLLETVRRSAHTGKRLSLPSVMAIGVHIASALEHVHSLQEVDGHPLGIVHRDVTPQNIMLSNDGHAKLIDFGIIRSSLQTHQTESGIVKGKFAYIAPEGLLQHGRMDQRADIFSLGICLYESLAARPLFRGKDERETLQKIRHLEIPDLSMLRSDVPPDIAKVIGLALARNPTERFQNATQMLLALEQAATRNGVVPSMTTLRDEALALCGPYEEPVVTREFHRFMKENNGALPSSETPSTEPSSDVYNAPTPSETGHGVRFARGSTSPAAVEEEKVIRINTTEADEEEIDISTPRKKTAHEFQQDKM